PGEFQMLWSMGRTPGDTIVTWDGRHQRITLLDTHGNVLATVSLAFAEAGDPIQNVLVQSGGRFVSVSEDRAPPALRRPLGFSRDSHFIAMLDTEGRRSSIIGTVPGSERFRGEVPLSSGFSYRFHIATTENAVFIGYGRGSSIVEYDRTGEASRKIRLPIGRRAISAAEREIILERFADRASTTV